MTPELQHLIELQTLDTAIAEARARIATHPQRLADADALLDEATHVLDAAKERLKTNQEHRRALEKDAAVYQARLDKFKDQLSAVKTNREYQAMQVEIETATRELATAEEKVIERMVDGDTITAEIKAAEAALAIRQKDVDATRKALEAELRTVQADLDTALAARTTLVAAIDQRVMALFERVGKQRKGVAICQATRDGLCSVCHVRLRPPVFQQVRMNTAVVQCESCQRILYYIPPPAPIEPPVVHTP